MAKAITPLTATSVGVDYGAEPAIAGSEVEIAGPPLRHIPAGGLVLALVILGGVVLERWNKAGRARAVLKADLADTRAALAQLDTEFRSAVETLHLGGPFNTWAIATNFSTEIDRLNTSAKHASGAGLEAITSQSADLKSSVTAWPELPAKLADLKSSLERLDAVPQIKASFWQDASPPQAPSTAASLRAFVTTLSTDTQFAKDWPRDGLEELAKRNSATAVPSVTGLFNALQVEDNPERAKAIVRDLTHYFEDLEAAEPTRRGLDGVAAIPPRFAGYPLRPPTTTSADLAASLRWRTALTDWLLVGLTAVALYAVAIGAVVPKDGYVGIRDVIAAIAWGFGASAVAGPLADVLVRARESAARLRGPTV